MGASQFKRFGTVKYHRIPSLLTPVRETLSFCKGIVNNGRVKFWKIYPPSLSKVFTNGHICAFHDISNFYLNVKVKTFVDF